MSCRVSRGNLYWDSNRGLGRGASGIGYFGFRGHRQTNMERRPDSLAAGQSQPTAHHLNQRLLRGSPIPVPSPLRDRPLSSCSNSSNMRAIWPAGMPFPVSVMSTQTEFFAA